MRWTRLAGAAAGVLLLAARAAAEGAEAQCSECCITVRYTSPFGAEVLAFAAFLLLLPWVLVGLAVACLKKGNHRTARPVALLSLLGGAAWMVYAGIGAMDEGWNPLSGGIPADEASQILLAQAAVVTSLGYFAMRSAEQQAEAAADAMEDRKRLRSHRGPSRRSHPSTRLRAPAADRAARG